MGSSNMSRAAVYVPLGIPDDGRYTLEAVDLIQHRGYEYAGIYRQAHYVDKLLREGIVQVVVLARDRHWDPECGWPVEIVDEATRPIRWVPPVLVRERRGTVCWSRDRVREILDTTGPLPTGLDSEAIAAARRIARRLNQG
jgi:hypothetical protein